jgi:hypothetical protein
MLDASMLAAYVAVRLSIDWNFTSRPHVCRIPLASKALRARAITLNLTG